MAVPVGPIWITEAEVVSLIDLGEAVTAVHGAFGEQATGRAQSLPKTQAEIGPATIHATGGAVVDGGYVATKSWTHTPDGATPMLLLWDLADGSLRAVMEAHALGQYRTAAVSAVATDVLAAGDATTFALLGTGSQALMQVAAVNCVRTLDTVTIWSPREESRTQMSKKVEDALAIKAVPQSTPEAAIGGASVITLVTRAIEPYLAASAPEPGAHLNAIGAIAPERAEFESDLLSRCAIVAVDELESARIWSRELRTHFGTEDGTSWSAVRSLADVVAEAPKRAADADLTLFKAMGAGIADLAIARFVYEQARENDLGRELPATLRSRPRLRGTNPRAAVGYA